MATFQGNIHSMNGYSSGKVEVNQVRTQSQARQVLEARYPGAKISGVHQISHKD